MYIELGVKLHFTPANYSSSMIADTKSTMADHHSKVVSRNPQALEGSKDFIYYQPLMSPRVKAEDAKLNDASSQSFTGTIPDAFGQQEESGREKLFRHWTEVAGTVCIPEKWGQEDFLKDWIDYSLFDVCLAPKGVVSAREALIAAGKQESTRHLMKMERMY